MSDDKPFDKVPNFLVSIDEEYTALLNSRVRDRFGSTAPRTATHLSGLLFCLLKEWANLHLTPEQLESIGELEDETLMTWTGGLQFEDLISEGKKQPVHVYCPKCKVVSSPPITLNNKEAETCQVCGKRVVYYTPDYIVDGMIHEAKQTRKSQRRGVEDAPWWIEQIAGYILFEKMAGRIKEDTARMVINWLMGNYGSRKKGLKPVPPRSMLEAHKVEFEEDGKQWDGWLAELMRRKKKVEGPERPALDFVDSPRYPKFECASCQVGPLIECPAYIWNEEGEETYPFGTFLAPSDVEKKEEGDAEPTS